MHNNTEPEPMDLDTSDNDHPQDQVNNNAEDERRSQKKNKAKDQEWKKHIIMASGKQFIKVFQKLLVETRAKKEDIFLYMQRVYHGIFFFGHINQPRVEPKDFLPAQSWDLINDKFPKPLAEYRTCLPSQTPYSILLEYVTKLYNGNTDSILAELQKRNKEMFATFLDDQKNQLQTKDFALSASVITYSSVNDPYSDNELKKAYGCSIAYKYSVPRRVMIAISALHVWDKVVSYEVRCKDRGRGINFPCDVYCTAFRFATTSEKYEAIPPCMKCHQMYKVNFDPKYMKPTKSQDWLYGNCAETESISNLLHNNINIRNSVYTSDDDGENLSRDIILKRFTAEHEGKLKKEICQFLRPHGFKETNSPLFIPDKYAAS